MLGGPTRLHPWQQALSWFVSSYPPLGGIASGITLAADTELARTHGISVAASYAEARDVCAARVVFCDAAPHGAGYLPVTEGQGSRSPT